MRAREKAADHLGLARRPQAEGHRTAARRRAFGLRNLARQPGPLVEQAQQRVVHRVDAGANGVQRSWRIDHRAPRNGGRTIGAALFRASLQTPYPGRNGRDRARFVAPTEVLIVNEGAVFARKPLYDPFIAHSCSSTFMPAYRSRTTTHGRNMAGARGLWRATGMKDSDFGKPIIAVVNSFTQFVPGHVHLKDLGQLVAREIERAGGVAKEFNTIAVDDGIAMGHDGMLYSLPSRELIADSVEYMVNAHCADAMVCISNCDKITPGMLMAALRINVPVVFVSGGPMEAGKVVLKGKTVALDLVDAMVAAADDAISDEDVKVIERSACPTCGSCSGMFTANSMNCLTEALGLSLPGNGSTLATHKDRERLFLEAGTSDRRPRQAVLRAGRRNRPAPRHRLQSPRSRTPCASTSPWADRPIRCCTCWPPRMRRRWISPWTISIDFPGTFPCLCKVAPAKADVHMEDVHRAGGVMAILGELDRAGLLKTDLPTVHSGTMAEGLARWDIAQTNSEVVQNFYRAAPGGVPTQTAFSQSERWDDARSRPRNRA